MKRNTVIALVTIAATCGLLTCLSIAQDPFGSEQTTQIIQTRPLGRIAIESSDVADVYATSVNINSNSKGEHALQENVAALVKQLKTSEGADKGNIVAKIKTGVEEHFDFRQDARTKELKILEEQLAKLKELHSKRTQQRDQIVADRVQQILREADGLGWGTTEPSDVSKLFGYGVDARPRAVGPSSTYGQLYGE